VNFLYGHPLWSVSIACEDAEGPLIGVVHHPDRDETFVAVRGAGAWLGERRLQVNDVSDLGQTLVGTGFSYDPEVRTDQARDLVTLLGRVRDVRRGGSAALDLAWVAAGRLDGYLEFDLSPWDWAAGGVIVREAGGVVTSHERSLGGEVRRGLVAGAPAVSVNLTRWLEERG
jgi:myo-inositol-1(or 4)-monophosphatase